MNDQLINILKKKLEQTYCLAFSVFEKTVNNNRTIHVELVDSNQSFFQLLVVIKNDIRLIIEIQPEKYSANFIEGLGEADIDKKKNFCSGFKYLCSLSSKLDLKINELPIGIEEIVSFSNKWSKFSLRFSKSPYFDPDNSDGVKEIIFYTTLLCGLILSLVDIEYSNVSGHQEGKARFAKTKKYERSPLNREICLSIKGYRCTVCGMLMEEIYGDIGRDFIHVHHTTPVSKMGKDYIVDPRVELVPVCPNCHAMIHRKEPPYEIAEMKKLLKST